MSKAEPTGTSQEYRWGFLVIAGFLTGLTSIGFGQEAVRQREPIHIDVNLVTLRFSVRDDRGSFMNFLNREEFTVLENGTRCQIAVFHRPRAPGEPGEAMWLAFLLDVSGSTFATRTEEILAAKTFFENVNELTRVGVFGFTDQLLTFQDFTEDRDLALSAFGAAQRHLGKTAIYRSLDSLIVKMNQAAAPDSSKAIIVVSDAMDPEYRLAAATAARARMAKVVLYTVWVPSASQLYIGPASGTFQGRSSAETQREKAAKEQAFARVSRESGGRHFGGFEAILDFDGVLAEINDEIFGNLYLIGYYTENPFLDRLERDILVSTQRPDLRVSGLFKELPDRDRAKMEIIEAFFDDDALARLTGSESIPFREIGAELDILKPRLEGTKAVLPIRIKISAFSLQKTEEGGLNTQFGIIALLADASGNETVRLREIFQGRLSAREVNEGRGIIYTNRVLAPPGKYDLKVAILEIPSWKMAVLERPVRLSSP